MSARNTLANKKIRRAEREDHAARLAKKRALQARMMELALTPEDSDPTETEGPDSTETEDSDPQTLETEDPKPHTASPESTHPEPMPSEPTSAE